MIKTTDSLMYETLFENVFFFLNDFHRIKVEKYTKQNALKMKILNGKTK